jgi:hypothetical protein
MQNIAASAEIYQFSSMLFLMRAQIRNSLSKRRVTLFETDDLIGGRG